MFEQVINKDLPIFPWSDPRLMKLPGTNRLNNEPLFLLCDKFKEQMKQRDELVRTKPDKVCLFKPEANDILEECLSFIIETVRKNPNYHVKKNYLSRPDKVQVDFSSQPKIESIARIIQEDILVHQFDPVDKKYKLIAGTLCFPSFWTLSQKMGMNLDRIHKPVPEYSHDIAKRVERLFIGLKPEHPIWRANWTVKNTPRLFMPLMEGDILPEKFSLSRDWWIRVERQTFNKLPNSGVVLFGIHTYVVSPEKIPKSHLEKLLEKLKLKTLIHH